MRGDIELMEGSPQSPPPTRENPELNAGKLQSSNFASSTGFTAKICNMFHDQIV